MYKELLARMPHLEDLSHRELTWLGESGRERDYAPGAVRQGGGCLGSVLMIAGSVEVTQRPDDGAERELSQLNPGAVWGKARLLEEAPCPGTLTAVEATRAVALPKWGVCTTLRDSPDLAIHLLSQDQPGSARISQRLGHTDNLEQTEESEAKPQAPGLVPS